MHHGRTARATEPHLATLLLGMLFGAIGVGYSLYGRRQRAPVPLASGVLLMLFPFFVPNAWVLFLIGAALTALPWFFRV